MRRTCSIPFQRHLWKSVRTMARGSEIVVFDIQWAFHLFFLLQHHMRGLGKLMNYPHRGKTVCVSCTIPRLITWSCLNLLNWGLNFPTLICPNSLYTVTFLYKQDDSMKKYLYKSETLLNLTRVVRSAMLTVLFYKKLGMYLQQFLWSSQVCVCVCAYWIPLGS